MTAQITDILDADYQSLDTLQKVDFLEAAVSVLVDCSALSDEEGDAEICVEDYAWMAKPGVSQSDLDHVVANVAEGKSSVRQLVDMASASGEFHIFLIIRRLSNALKVAKASR